MKQEREFDDFVLNLTKEKLVELAVDEALGEDAIATMSRLSRQTWALDMVGITGEF